MIDSIDSFIRLIRILRRHGEVCESVTSDEYMYNMHMHEQDRESREPAARAKCSSCKKVGERLLIYQT